MGNVWLFEGFDKRVYKWPWNETIGDSSVRFGGYDRLVGSYELCVRVIGMERDAAMWVLACRFIDGVALSGAWGAEKNLVARCVESCWDMLLRLMLLCFRPTVQLLQFGIQVFELVGCWVVLP